MKRCQKCGTSYTDDTLRFCLEDGTELTASDEQQTVVRPAGRDPYQTEELPRAVTHAARDPLRIEIPTDRTTTGSPPPTIQPNRTGSMLLKILLGAVLLGVLVVLGAGVLGVAFYYLGRQNTVDIKTPTPTPTPDDEKTKLEKELADLKKKLEDSNKSGDDTNPFPGDEETTGPGRTATVNSPSDGFLALRNLPSADIGDRIAKIPHGSTIKVLTCSDQSVNVGSRSGHWCLVTYRTQSGWVFDAWLDY